MQVTFYKLVEKRLSYWVAIRGKRTRVPGSPMALGRGDLPHDLKQMIVEATLGLDHGFWGSVADGATFRSTGRKRTVPGRRVIADNKAALDEAEHLAGDHVRRWMSGAPTESGPALDDFDSRWNALADGQGLTIEWPSLRFVGVETEPPAKIG